MMSIEDVWKITGKGIMVTGKSDSGNFKVGDKVEITDGKNTYSTKLKNITQKDSNIGLGFDDLDVSKIKRGMTVKKVNPSKK